MNERLLKFLFDLYDSNNDDSLTYEEINASEKTIETFGGDEIIDDIVQMWKDL